jgi:hypothetical protein
MRSEAIFLNGVWEGVLQDILNIQQHLPEHIMYLQPHKGKRIVLLAQNPPSTDDPVRLLMSVTDNLSNISYVAEIVGWDDKRELSGPKLTVLNRLIYAFQWTEGGVYPYVRNPKKPCVNLLHIRRLQKLQHTFSVAELHNVKDEQPLSTGRTQSGGWTYVQNPSDTWLAGYL